MKDIKIISLAALLAGTTFVGINKGLDLLEKNVSERSVYLESQRYLVDSTSNKAVVSFNLVPYIGSYSLYDTNKDGKLDYVSISKIGPAPNGGRSNFSPSPAHQQIYDKVMGAWSNRN